MAIRFAADEVFEMALQIERNGAKFYRGAADKAAEGRIKGLLMRLAAWEEQHEQVFAAMRAELSEEERQPKALDPEGQAAMYLRALADGEVFGAFGDPSQVLTGQESVETMLQIAVGFEKDSIVFYTGMKHLVPPRLGQARIDGIIEQELAHVALLSDELATLKQR